VANSEAGCIETSSPRRGAFRTHGVQTGHALLFKVKAVVALGDDVKEAGPGMFIHMQPGLKRSIKAKTPVFMPLVLLK